VSNTENAVTDYERQNHEVNARLQRGESVRFEDFPDTPPELKTLDRALAYQQAHRLRSQIAALHTQACKLMSSASDDDLLRDVVPFAPDSGASPDLIIAIVVDAYQVHQARLYSESREQHLTVARQVAMCLLYRLTPFSFPRIGQLFRRDHSTVIHACARVAFRVSIDPGFAHHLAQLARLAQGATESPPAPEGGASASMGCGQVCEAAVLKKANAA
jgi:DnaA-like protein